MFRNRGLWKMENGLIMESTFKTSFCPVTTSSI